MNEEIAIENIYNQFEVSNAKVEILKSCCLKEQSSLVQLEVSNRSSVCVFVRRNSTGILLKKRKDVSHIDTATYL